MLNPDQTNGQGVRTRSPRKPVILDQTSQPIIGGPVSPAKFGRLWAFCEVDTWLLKVRFCVLLCAFRCFPSLSVL